MLDNSSIIIVGHRNPDLDSVVSAIVCASLKRKMGEAAEAKIAGEVNKETKFVLTYFNQETPEVINDVSGKKVFLVDHNAATQAVAGLNEAELIGVIDHHCIGIKTELPIFYRAEPLGSTSTVLAKLFKENGIAMDQQEAGLLLAGIVSDTLFFNSPTTTEQDKKIAVELAKTAKVNIEELADKIFDAKSDLTGVPIEKIVGGDVKEFESGNTKFGIGVFETARPQTARELDEKIFAEMESFKQKNRLALFFFFVVDILEKNSVLYLLAEKETRVAKQIFTAEIQGKIMFLPGIVSRKKQILPPLMKAIADF
ncbi:MAG: manganese-dependent inorganic pyrophosphatase [bacterium]